MPHIIGLTGLMGCGKGTAAAYYKEQHGAVVFKVSTIMRDMLDLLHLPMSREHVIAVSEAMRKEFGEAVFAEAIAKQIAARNETLFVVDGLRRPADIVPFKDIGTFHLVAIVADDRLRYERIKLRNENIGEQEKTFEQFLTDQKHLPTEKTIPGTMQLADYTIENDSTLETLYTELRKLFITQYI